MRLLVLLLFGCQEKPSSGTTETIDADGDGAAAEDDCDDSNASRYPDADEVCDGIDNDCDGDIDEDAVNAEALYEDGDGDGFGSAEALICPGAGWEVNAGDCDDDNATISPAAEEVCDGIDNNCDDQIDEGLTLEAWPDLDGDGYGAEVEAHTVCVLASGEVDISGDCDDTDASVFPEADEIIDGIDNDCNGIVDPEISPLSDANVLLYGESPADAIGGSITSVGDINGDGSDDLLVGAPVASNRGVVWLMHGPLGGQRSMSTADARMEGISGGDFLGGQVVGPGDLTGDGEPDLAVSASYRDDAGTYSGTTYIIPGPVLGEVDLRQDALALVGAHALDLSGYMLAGPGDLTGDGVVDLLVGAPNADEGGEDVGTLYIVAGPVSTSESLADADFLIIGDESINARLSTLKNAGDTNGDGMPDVVLGSVVFSGDGVGWLVAGPVTADISLADAAASFSGDSGDYYGWSINGAGDTNGDGYDDVVLGIPGTNSAGGVAYVFHGPVTGSVDVETAQATFLGRNNEYAGFSVSGVGDGDQDGFDDVLIGAYANSDIVKFGGAAYLMRGPLTGTQDLNLADLTLYGTSNSESAGEFVTHAGDLNDDGVPDMLVGATGSNAGLPSGGAAYILWGGE